jgi:hypothetical protein
MAQGNQIVLFGLGFVDVVFEFVNFVSWHMPKLFYLVKFA